MNKRLKGKKCVYCGTAPAKTEDHVWARSMMPVARRGTIPKVPACPRCNNEKAKLELYLSTVLPFGSREPDALEHLQGDVARRIAGNKKLARELEEQQSSDIEIGPDGVVGWRPSVPFRWEALEEYLKYVVKGLAAHHWQVDLSSDVEIIVVGLVREMQERFEGLRTLNGASPVEGTVGTGSLEYWGLNTKEDPRISAWQFQIMSGARFASDSGDPAHDITHVGIYVARPESAARIRKFLGIEVA